jgi:hypothetical protein
VTAIGDLLDQLDGEDLQRLAERLAPYLRQNGGGWLDTKQAAEYAGCTGDDYA